MNNPKKQGLKRKYTPNENNIKNVLTDITEKEENVKTVPCETLSNTVVIHTPEKRYVKRRAVPRVSIPVFGTSQNVIEEISSTLSQVTMESGYDSPNTCLFSQLPNEIILSIFNCLNDCIDLLSVSCVSQRCLILASDSNLWKSLYAYYYGTRFEIESTIRSWKFNFLVRRKELLTKSDHKSYTKKKKRQLRISSDDIVSIPERRTIPCKENTTLTQTSQSCWDEPEPHVMAFLLEKKQFFDSLESVSLVTVTPCKKSRKRL